MIPRALVPIVQQDAAAYPVVGILGPRQAGKTTLARSIFADYVYTNLEDPETRRFASDDPRGFLSQRAAGMIIDEFQRVPELLSYIQTIVDEEKVAGQFILTGSQNYLMMESISQSLAGRIALFTLPPLSMAELAGAGVPVGQDFSRDDIMRRGMFPRVWDAAIDPNRYYANYIQTYVERDVRMIQNVGDLNRFDDFLRLVAGRVGQVVNLTSLADDAGISHNTAKSWLSILQTSYIVQPLRPYHRNFNKQIIKSPKLFFTDTGIVCYLLGIESDAMLQHHPLIGGIFENFVVSEVAKGYQSRGRQPRLYFWRDKRGHEVDLLLDDGLRRTAIEIKAGRTMSSDYFKGLEYYAELDAACPPDARYVIYGGERTEKRTAATVLGWRALADDGLIGQLVTSQ